MKIVAISVGAPREVRWKGELVRTSIFKTPVEGPVRARRLNLEGDEQSDLEVHGGEEKAVYAYPAEHYEFWRRELPGVDLPWGAFGENFTVEGLLEETVRIGDRLLAGTARFAVTQPRMPCYKLGLRFGDPRMVRRFLKSGRSGFYLSVTQEGEVSPGQAIALAARDERSPSVAEVVRALSRVP